MTKNKRMAILEHDKSNHLARIQFLEKKLSALEEYLSIAFDDGIPVIPKMSRYKKVCKKCNHYVLVIRKNEKTILLSLLSL